MLILSRNIGQSICIGPDITVSVLSIKSGNQVRLGIIAPRNVPVDRSEIRTRKDAEKEQP